MVPGDGDDDERNDAVAAAPVVVASRTWCACCGVKRRMVSKL